MTKRYKLLKDLPTFKAGETFHIDENGNLVADNTQGYQELIAYTASTLKKFPDILGDWFEEIEEKYEPWRGENGEEYWLIDEYGDIRCVQEHIGPADGERYSMGNYFQTRGEAERDLAKRKAYQTIKRDAKGFEPDWGDCMQDKWYARYDRYMKKCEITYAGSGQVLGNIYFSTEEDIEHSLKQHPDEWILLFDLDFGGE